MNALIPIELVTSRIFDIRGQRVMIDSDLALLYGVTTKALNQAVKRNPERFPEDFMFQLTAAERDELVTVCDRLARLRFATVTPHAFTESGVAMLSSVLNSQRAALVNVQIVRAFVRLRRLMADHDALRIAIEGLERRTTKSERDIQIALGALQKLLTPPLPPKPQRKIGFGPR
jgi:hypothetical protein